ncbi:MAG TPA: DUF58 domain-containing protein [Verrucomicrobiae bacterium]|jgi:uncharacterized protein (DUF58 family)|nr:DUF58 domain-containing protein [Verrucomicrobiae bacterium]
MPSSLAINASVLAAVDDLSLVARAVVEGFFDGLHRSPFLGYSTEFSAYRPYVEGDNLRYVDWKVWGRTDEYYVKQFEDDTNVRCHIFLDTSGSMDFGAGDANKFNYARTLAAVLAYLMIRQHDAPGLIVFGAQSRQAAPASSARHHADEIFQLLTHVQAGGRTNVDQQLFHIAQTITRRGLAVVISDFLGAGEGCFELLRQLHGQGQEILVFHLMAPEEMDLPYEGEFIMEDCETGAEVPVNPEVFREEYQKRVKEFCEKVRKQCVDFEIEYEQLRTDKPLDIALMKYLERRMG